MNYKKARNFIYKNARPIDIARWQYLFENGNRDNVLKALSSYQNKDGGFGHALEPDCWNPNSSPIQTWAATEIIKEVKLEDKENSLILGILNYLSSGKDFDGHVWFNTVTTNDDYPHAPWWNYQKIQSLPYNPTASLIGFILKFAKRDTKIYNLAWNLAKESYCYFKNSFPLDSMSTVSCFIDLYDYLKELSINDLIDMKEFKFLLSEQIHSIITKDKSKWEIDYVCKPSQFIHNKSSDFYLENKDLCDYECDFISNTQLLDGSWAITWSWDDYLEEWYISKNWWKSDWVIKYIKFIYCFRENDFNML